MGVEERGLEERGVENSESEMKAGDEGTHDCLNVRFFLENISCDFTKPGNIGFSQLFELEQFGDPGIKIAGGLRFRSCCGVVRRRLVHVQVHFRVHNGGDGV